MASATLAPRSAGACGATWHVLIGAPREWVLSGPKGFLWVPIWCRKALHKAGPGGQRSVCGPLRWPGSGWPGHLRPRTCLTNMTWGGGGGGFWMGCLHRSSRRLHRNLAGAAGARTSSSPHTSHCNLAPTVHEASRPTQKRVTCQPWFEGAVKRVMSTMMFDEAPVKLGTTMQTLAFLAITPFRLCPGRPLPTPGVADQGAGPLLVQRRRQHPGFSCRGSDSPAASVSEKPRRTSASEYLQRHTSHQSATSTAHVLHLRCVAKTRSSQQPIDLHNLKIWMPHGAALLRGLKPSPKLRLGNLINAQLLGLISGQNTKIHENT